MISAERREARADLAVRVSDLNVHRRCAARDLRTNRSKGRTAALLARLEGIVAELAQAREALAAFDAAT